MKMENQETHIILDWSTQVENILKIFKICDFKQAKTPGELNLRLAKAKPESTKANAATYRSLVGALLILA